MYQWRKEVAEIYKRSFHFRLTPFRIPLFPLLPYAIRWQTKITQEERDHNFEKKKALRDVTGLSAAGVIILSCLLLANATVQSASS